MKARLSDMLHLSDAARRLLLGVRGVPIHQRDAGEAGGGHCRKEPGIHHGVHVEAEALRDGHHDVLGRHGGATEGAPQDLGFLAALRRLQSRLLGLRAHETWWLEGFRGGLASLGLGDR